MEGKESCLQPRSQIIFYSKIDQLLIYFVQVYNNHFNSLRDRYVTIHNSQFTSNDNCRNISLVSEIFQRNRLTI